jgi:hypothetical protein
MAEAESGINPLDRDPIGFRQRCARRIEKGRVFVVVEDNELIFKADIQADTLGRFTSKVSLLISARRGEGFGRRCLTQLTHMLPAAHQIDLPVGERAIRRRTRFTGWRTQTACQILLTFMQPAVD